MHVFRIHVFVQVQTHHFAKPTHIHTVCIQYVYTVYTIAFEAKGLRKIEVVELILLLSLSGTG